MKLLAFNGSPRKKWNTAQLLDHALKGAESEGAKTRLYHLYDLDLKVVPAALPANGVAVRVTGTVR